MYQQLWSLLSAHTAILSGELGVLFYYAATQCGSYFRPIVVPAGVELKITVSPDSRNTAWVSFDGRKRQELCHGDSLRVTTSIYPIPSICSQDQITDWFDSLAECLHWNVRKKQRTLDELSDLSSDPYEETKQES